MPHAHELVLDALRMAPGLRLPCADVGLIRQLTGGATCRAWRRVAGEPWAASL